MILQSSPGEGFKINGGLNKDQNYSWNFQVQNQSPSILQSNTCSYPNSSMDFSICCKLCSAGDICPDIVIISEHSRYDLIVTNRGLMVELSRGNFRCLLFPSVY